MILAGLAVALVLVSWAGYAAWLAFTLGLSPGQALLYAPLRLAYRISDRSLRDVRSADAPVIYAITHESRLDPALMLALLPADTLHILDEESARAHWLEPYRSLARSIAFNAQHVFVSRRLVRRLRGNGRLAVYLPGGVEPDARIFRLYRAVAKIAQRAGARVVPIHIAGSRDTPFSLLPPEAAPRRWFPRLRIAALEAKPLEHSPERRRAARDTISNILFDRVAEARISAVDPSLTLFSATVDAAGRNGAGRVVIEDATGRSMSYRELLARARLLAARLDGRSEPREAIGLMLANGADTAAAFLAVQSAARVAAMLDPSAGPAGLAAAAVTTRMRTIVSSRAFVAAAGLDAECAALQRAGADIVWLEDLHEPGWAESAVGWLGRHRPTVRAESGDPAVVFFHLDAEGGTQGVVLSHRNLVANAAQIATRVALSPADSLLVGLPLSSPLGLAGGLVLPLLTGMRAILDPAHPRDARITETFPTVALGTGPLLAGNRRPADLASLRLVITGEPIGEDARRTLRERTVAMLAEGYGAGAGMPLAALNSATHRREGSAGRPLAGISMRLEVIDGIADGDRLLLSGPNAALGTMHAERPGELRRPQTQWHDTGAMITVDREGFLTMKGRARDLPETRVA